MNDMALKLNSTQQNEQVDGETNSHFSGLMEDAVGKDAESLGPGILNSPLSKTVTLTEESSSILKDCGEVEVTKEPSYDDMAGHSAKQANVYQLTKNVEEEVTDSNRTNAKKIYTSNIPCKTRQSSRLQDADVYMQEKAIARKAFTKGITSSSIPPPPPNSSCSLDLLARVCGFSLGSDESSRIANSL